VSAWTLQEMPNGYYDSIHITENGHGFMSEFIRKIEREWGIKDEQYIATAEGHCSPKVNSAVIRDFPLTLTSETSGTFFAVIWFSAGKNFFVYNYKKWMPKKKVHFFIPTFAPCIKLDIHYN
jgi:hypothetical protein